MQKINFENLPSTNTPINASNLNQIQTNVENAINNVENIELLAVTNIAPSECSEGDKYFNIDTKLIYEATATDTWSSTGTTPISDIFYIVLSEQKIYTYNGTTLVSVGSGAGGTSNVYSTSTVEGYSANYVNNHSLTVSEAEPIDKTKLWVQSTGNLFDVNNANILNALLRTSDNTLYASSSERSLYVECKPNTTYRITKNEGARFRVDERANTPTTGSANVNMVMNDKVSSITYTTSANGNYLVVNYFTTSETGTEQDMLNSISIEVVSSINVYEDNAFKEIYRKPMMLWTNPNPTSNFAAQNITLSTSDYDMYEVYYKHNASASSNILCFTLRAFKGFGTQALHVININQGVNQQTGFRIRTVNYVNDNTLSVSDGLQRDEISGVPNVNNGILVPIYIVGYKTGLFS